MLTGERPCLHSSFIAALCQTLLSIYELEANRTIDAAADVLFVCGFPVMAAETLLVKYASTVNGQVKLVSDWDTAIDFAFVTQL